MFGNKHNLINVCQSNRTSQHYLLHVVTDTVSFYKQNIHEHKANKHKLLYQLFSSSFRVIK